MSFSNPMRYCRCCCCCCYLFFVLYFNFTINMVENEIKNNSMNRHSYTKINESKWTWTICIDTEIYCNKIGFYKYYSFFFVLSFCFFVHLISSFIPKLVSYNKNDLSDGVSFNKGKFSCTQNKAKKKPFKCTRIHAIQRTQ